MSLVVQQKIYEFYFRWKLSSNSSTKNDQNEFACCVKNKNVSWISSMLSLPAWALGEFLRQPNFIRLLNLINLLALSLLPKQVRKPTRKLKRVAWVVRCCRWPIVTRQQAFQLDLYSIIIKTVVSIGSSSAAIPIRIRIRCEWKRMTATLFQHSFLLRKMFFLEDLELSDLFNFSDFDKLIKITSKFDTVYRLLLVTLLLK